MPGRHFGFVLVSATGLLGILGCCHTRQQCGYLSNAAPACPSCNGGGPLPPRLAPIQTPAAPGAVAPAGVEVPAAPPGVPGTAAPLPPGPVSPEPGARLSAPVPAAPVPPAQNRFYPPQTQEPPRATQPPGVKEERQAATPSLPVDIPQFAVVKPGVTSGQQPFPDGVTWLKNQGYRTVLHVRSPAEDDTAAKLQFEKNGLRYLSLELSPTTLTKEVLDRFIQTVNDKTNEPLFVYDRDGSLAGALWYLYFRLGEGASDEKARAEAVRLGFKLDQDQAHRTMWVAVQNFLQTQKR